MKVLVVLPTYNERPNLETLAARLLQHPFASLLVVDDASPDGTGELADRLSQTTNGRVSVLHRTGPRGLGRAYIDGLRHALTTDADAIGQMDGDLSHDPSYLPSLVESLASHDLVIGSRYMRGVSVVNWSLRRIALSAFANRYIRAVTGLRASDVTSGYRLWRREALAKQPLDHAQASGYAFLTEMLYHAARTGCRIGEVPIVFYGREEGDSKVSLKVLFESLLTPWRLLLRSGRIPASPRP
jgi:dolichol-phosphate mannosyltransferase